MHKLTEKYLQKQPDYTSIQYAFEIRFEPSIAENDVDLRWKTCAISNGSVKMLIVFSPLPKENSGGFENQERRHQEASVPCYTAS